MHGQVIGDRVLGVQVHVSEVMHRAELVPRAGQRRDRRHNRRSVTVPGCLNCGQAIIPTVKRVRKSECTGVVHSHGSRRRSPIPRQRCDGALPGVAGIAGDFRRPVSSRFIVGNAGNDELVLGNIGVVQFRSERAESAYIETAAQVDVDSRSLGGTRILVRETTVNRIADGREHIGGRARSAIGRRVGTHRQYHLRAADNGTETAQTGFGRRNDVVVQLDPVPIHRGAELPDRLKDDAKGRVGRGDGLEVRVRRIDAHDRIRA